MTVVKSIELVGRDTVILPIVGATSREEFLLKEASGLGPPDVDVHMGTTLYAGDIYHGRRPQAREIVLRVGLNPDYSNTAVSDLRARLYQLLSTKQALKIWVRFVYDETDLNLDPNDYAYVIDGYFKRVEIVPFSKDPEVQITITCPQALFSHPVELTFGTLDVFNPGTAPTPFYITMTLNEYTNDVVIYTIPFEEDNYISQGYSLYPYDILELNTDPGSRGFWFTRDDGFGYAPVLDITGFLSQDSKWPTLYNGDNEIAIKSSIDGLDVDVTIDTISFTPRYWGV